MKRLYTHPMQQRALITGGSSGIGRAYAHYLTGLGWRLDLAAQSENRLMSAAAGLDGPVHCYPVDLASSAGVQQLVSATSVPDLIIANAGITKAGSVGTLSQSESAKLQYLLCGGVIDLVQWAAPIMKSRGHGRIIIISSIAAETPMPNSSIYASAKTGVTAFGRSIHNELKPHGVSVTISLPGYVRTNIHERAGLHHLIRQVPDWMWLSPEQVVRETEKASLAGRETIVPGRIYRLTRPFLGSRAANTAWRALTRRRRNL
ncbi:SDR family NAD(P)-dependent oxidoreductase [Pseudomonadales bacterium]|nr:SDR family NAD(P)-dependent oxidoreductase [Pseudomonadales bacterium]